MNVLVTYDVSTTSAEGRRRLRRVAQACKDFGQRVQFSVFECVVGEKELFLLRHRLLEEIDREEDSLRIYRLAANLVEGVECYGQQRTIDFEGPLVV